MPEAALAGQPVNELASDLLPFSVRIRGLSHCG